MVLKATDEELQRSSNFWQRVFARMGRGGLVVGISILEFLPEFLQLEYQYLRFIGNRSSEEGNGLNDVVDGIFELFSWVN